MESVIAELEGTILKDPDPFAYFMLIAFEASGPVRFAVLLLLWPLIRLLDLLGKREFGLRLMIFIAVVGIRISEIECVGRAVLPKFYMDDLDTGKWRLFARQNGKKIVVTKTPRVMVERFVKDHLMVDHVIGSELVVNRFGFATGLVTDVGSFLGRVGKFIGPDEPCFVLGTSSHFEFTTFKEGCSNPKCPSQNPSVDKLTKNIPRPVIFHDGRLAKRPIPSTALLILLWCPVGVVVATIRMGLLLIIPMGLLPFELLLGGTYYKVKGKIPATTTQHSLSSRGGVLFVCNHRTFADPVILSHIVCGKVSAVTYSLSRLIEVLSPLPTVRLTRNRQLDANIIKTELSKGHLVICPEGTTCREPFLLRFSALFAELTDEIVPVGFVFHPLFFHATTARGWKALDMFFYFMNPATFYEVTFLDKLEAKDLSDKTPFEVANRVQSLLGTALGFTSTDYTRKDKYTILAGNNGIVT